MPYNLLDEGWIPCVQLDGSTTYVGLLDTLYRAHELRGIQGEAPVVTAALYRLLLAFAHRALGGPRHTREWGELWTSPTLAEKWIDKRIQQYRADFDSRFLLDGQQHPFLQSPGLAYREFGSAAKLVFHRATGNNVTLFDHLTAADEFHLHPATAARWLVTTHAFDAGGLKSPDVNGAKSSVRGLCNYFGTAVVIGKNLKETLLLNLPVYAPDQGLPLGTREQDRPAWEADTAPEPRADQEGRPPLGWTDLLTWPSRRVLLQHAHPDGAPAVTGAVITPGTRPRGRSSGHEGTSVQEDLHHVEMMAAFRAPVRSASGRSASKSTGARRLLPVQLERVRGIWRHAHEFLLPVGEPVGQPRLRPRTIDHVAQMIDQKELSSSHRFTLRVYGQQLDDQGGAVEAWHEEALPMPVALLRTTGSDWPLETLLGLAVGLADDVGEELANLERSYRRVQKGDLSEEAARMQRWYWPVLDRPFQRVLGELGDLVAQGEPEQTTTRRALRRHFKGWGCTVQASARQAVDIWQWKHPRTTSRQLLALADLGNVFGARLQELGTAYSVRVKQICW
ncbi:type I-E CRISPR-associated protein Cse1/CasA [Lipingzhangella sp. LS1_29]|uniref:Type I-E CRISPR-associated protein Cse1/CasA n=1 Tax=Lipingzhangella rawalii TaxID=2055835 RepID=A0ABU2H7D8_9ACTN|nr:type I-E CRISPR-associated protein Cse1/CasA [Lipingzhangella rawalii]MDS1270529.1 type I-E CRISPR-associated protein Cse1/CasA [Lipingzhangella rawalii]